MNHDLAAELHRRAEDDQAVRASRPELMTDARCAERIGQVCLNAIT
ncbi:hypothetical protein [Streptomyces sp. NBC_00989]|nr:hypothetical protein OG714_00130 [Streptomyces sp. NBC_00989]WSW98142.1 hypothetical protein OG714_54010 [Streptomyces sp. NBC_00989]